jgi:UrcA family protein
MDLSQSHSIGSTPRRRSAWVASLALLATYVVVPGAHAGDTRPGRIAPESIARAVNIADLDLMTDAGKAEAHSRVLRAARVLCRRLRDSRRVDAEALYLECTQDAYARAWQVVLARIAPQEAMPTASTR